MPLFHRELTLKGRMKDLPAVIEFVEACCEEAAVTDDYRFDIVLAVEEACSNVFEHAYKGKAGELKITFVVEDSNLRIGLHDRGRPFDPTKVERPDMSIPLEERPVGGLGMHLMHQLMDAVRYSFTPDGNTLTMTKRGVTGAPEAGSHDAPHEGRSG